MSDDTSHPTNPEDPTTRSLDASSEMAERIGPYLILQQLGEGGMGEVWLAEQTTPVRRRVAVKIIKRGLDTKQIVARFEAERQALAIMDHPNIAKVHDAGATADGRPFFVMEYVQGESITTYCDRQRLTTHQRLELFTLVCEGVQHAHHKAVIHRDLKPSNILVSVVDGKPIPKIIDFGVAKAIEHRLTERTMFTELGVLIGTPEYMSPEQAEMGTTDVDTRTDVYALGVVLYALLTGALPFDSESLRAGGYDEIRRRIREEDPSRPSTRISTLGDASTESARRRRTEPRALTRELRGDLDWITMRALEKDRTRRYDSPAALADDIRRHLQHEPVLAGPPSATYRAGRFVRRHTVGVVVTAVAVVATLGFAVAMTVQAQRIAAERDRADREREGAEQVAEFLSDMLGGVEPEVLGASLWSNLRARVETAQGTETALASFDEVFDGVNPTNAAVQLLDEEILARAGVTIDQRLAEQPLIAARLRAKVGHIYSELGLYDPAEGYYRRALTDRRRLLGDDDLDTLRSVEDLGTLLEAHGRLEEAEPFYVEAHEGFRRVLGADHPEALRATGNMGHLLESQGKLPEAEAYYREALDGLRLVLGDDHPSTLTGVNNMGFVLHAQGKLQKAESYYQEGLAGRRRVLGDDHPSTLLSIHNMGYILEAQGRLDEAEPYYREALEEKRRVLGDDHPSTLTSIHNMGILLRDQGRYEEAEAHYREALEGRRRALGDGHQDTLASIGSLGVLLEAQGKLEEAERYDRQAVEGCRRALGDEHPDTFTALNNLGAVLLAQGRFDEAESLWREALEGRLRVLGDEHPDTLFSLNNTGGLLHARGKFDEAEGYWRDALEISRRVLGDDHPQTLNSIHNLGALLRSQGKLDEAESYARESVDGYRRSLGDDHPDTLFALRALGHVLKMQQRLDEAETSYRQAFEGFRRTLGDEHTHTLDSLYIVGCAAAARGDRREALDRLQEAVDLGWARSNILTSEDLDPLRGDPEFEAIVATVENRLTEE